MNAKKEFPMKWEIRQRLTLLEATVLWTGELTTNVLIQAFGISRAQASKDLSSYQKICPQNLQYDASQKRYLTTDAFSPVFIEGTPDEYLRLTKLSQAFQSNEENILTHLPAVTLLEPATGRVNFSALQIITRAIRLKENIQYRYHTMSDKPSYDCVLSPNTLVYNGYRWHIRGFSHTHEEYRDFVLSRIEKPNILKKELDYIHSQNDDDWNTWVDVKFSPHPDLSRVQKQIIADDFGMKGYSKSVRMRGALVQYFLNLMSINPKEKDKPGYIQYIILKNEKDLSPYLW